MVSTTVSYGRMNFKGVERTKNEVYLILLFTIHVRVKQSSSSEVKFTYKLFILPKDML